MLRGPIKTILLLCHCCEVYIFLILDKGCTSWLWPHTFRFHLFIVVCCLDTVCRCICLSTFLTFSSSVLNIVRKNKFRIKFSMHLSICEGFPGSFCGLTCSMMFPICGVTMLLGWRLWSSSSFFKWMWPFFLDQAQCFTPKCLGTNVSPFPFSPSVTCIYR